jgi:hypothetical protein
VRTVILDHLRHALVVQDCFESSGQQPHVFEIPLHLALDVTAEERRPGELVLHSGSRQFVLFWQGDGDWQLSIGAGRVSPSYGVARPIVRLSWRSTSVAPMLQVMLAPENFAAQAARHWSTGLVSKMAGTAPS